MWLLAVLPGLAFALVLAFTYGIAMMTRKTPPPPCWFHLARSASRRDLSLQRGRTLLASSGSFR